MASRPVVIDAKDLYRGVPSDACPTCAASMAWARYSHGTPVRYPIFRCPPAAHPRVFEVRCRACGRPVLMYESGGRTIVVPGDQAELRRWLRDQERSALDE